MSVMEIKFDFSDPKVIDALGLPAAFDVVAAKFAGAVGQVILTVSCDSFVSELRPQTAVPAATAEVNIDPDILKYVATFV